MSVYAQGVCILVRELDETLINKWQVAEAYDVAVKSRTRGTVWRVTESGVCSSLRRWRLS